MTRKRLAETLDTDAMVSRLLDWYALATPDQLAAGATWYPAALDWARKLADRTGHTVVQVAAVMAATSPQTRWADNLRDTENLLRNLPKRSGAMSANLARARRVLAADDPLDELTRGSKTGKRGGPKMYAFASNILGDIDQVTIDTWAVRAALDLAWRNEDDTEQAQRVIGWVGAYERIADAYRKAAAQLGIPASSLQAVVWCAIRGRAE